MIPEFWGMAYLPVSFYGKLMWSDMQSTDILGSEVSNECALLLLKVNIYTTMSLFFVLKRY